MPDPDAAGALIRRYYEAFNAGDRPGMLALLTETVAHDINQGGREVGRDAFAAFLAHMDRCYREQIVDLAVMVDATGTRALPAADKLTLARQLVTEIAQRLSNTTATP